MSRGQLQQWVKRRLRHGLRESPDCARNCAPRRSTRVPPHHTHPNQPKELGQSPGSPCGTTAPWMVRGFVISSPPVRLIHQLLIRPIPCEVSSGVLAGRGTKPDPGVKGSQTFRSRSPGGFSSPAHLCNGLTDSDKTRTAGNLFQAFDRLPRPIPFLSECAAAPSGRPGKQSDNWLGRGG